MCSFGTPSEPIQSMFTTIQDMLYYTFTLHVLSDSSFCGMEKGYKAKLNGLGQENGAVPSIWSVVSTNMFQVMHNKDNFTTTASPIGKEKLCACGFAFVDEIGLISMPSEINCQQNDKVKMKRIIHEWEAAHTFHCK